MIEKTTVEQTTPQIQLIGDFCGTCGLSQSARDLAETMAHLGVKHEILDIPFFAGRDEEHCKFIAKSNSLTPSHAPICILNFNADTIPSVVKMLPPDYFSNRYVIGVWYWETEIFPPQHAVGFDYVDEIWVSSEFVRQALEKCSPVPVRQFRHLVHLPQKTDPSCLPDRLKTNQFLFLFCFHFGSLCERKNPMGVCKAFISAFSEITPSGPLCVIKSVGAEPDHLFEYLELKQQFRHRSDIIFVDGWLPSDQRDALMNRAHCYVSLHRSEGLGLTPLESMSLGKPCIATAYSGNLDYMTPENSWLIPYELIPVGPNRSPFPANHLWAEPDLGEAAAAMREAVSNFALLSEKARQALLTIKTRHSLDSVAASISQLLKESTTQKPRSKPGLIKTAPKPVQPSASPRKVRPDPSLLAKEAKTLHKATHQQVKKLKGWNIPNQLRANLESILKIQESQLEVQSHLMREIGKLQKRLDDQAPQNLDQLIENQRRTGLLLRDLLNETLKSPPQSEFNPKI